MDKKLRFLFLITIALVLIGTFPSTSALAGNNLSSSHQSSGEAMLANIMGNPCGNAGLFGVDIKYIACTGHAGATSMITVPLSNWETVPDYPLNNYPFYIGIGTTIENLPGTNTPYYFPRRDVTFPALIDIDGLRTEVRLKPYKPSSYITWKYNGLIEFGENMSFLQGDFRNYYGDPVGDAIKVFGSQPVPTSASDSVTHGDYYEDGVDGAVDQVVLRAITTNSSYHAPSPASYRGEPAYRIEIDSHYIAQARVTYQNYRLWERFYVETKTVCKPGPNNTGGYDCQAPAGNWYEPGHYETIDIYKWDWGSYQGSGESDWITVDIDVIVDSMRAPDGSIHDHIPIAVYQSQPILQQP